MIKRWADQFFRWFCHPDYYPDIQGDLDELYQDRLSDNPSKAQWNYVLDVLRLIRPSLMKPIMERPLINDTGMFRNYFKISIRNLAKQKLYSAVNIIGLAIGLAAFLLLNEYIKFERSYDRFFADSENIYRLTTDQVKEGVIGTRDAMSWNPSGKAFKEEFPEVLDYTTTFKFNELVFRHKDQVRFERNVVGADSNYFKLFDYNLLQGDAATALNDPYSLVLSETKAESYFGDQDPVGKEIELLGNFNRPFKVTGVVQDIPENTHYKFDMLMSIKSIQGQLDNDGWNGFNYYTYLKLIPNADLDRMEAQFPELVDKYMGEETTLIFNLQPMETIHLYSDFTYEPEIHGSYKTVSFLVIISIFVLIIAWVNYVNLSTARAVDRAKEVGLRKVIGAYRKQLIAQFFIESLIINFIGAVIAIGLTELILPYFNGLIEKEITSHVWNQRSFLLNALSFFAVGTLVSGFYPALVLSGFKPVAVLKGKFRNSKNGVALRKGLVTIQFTVSLVLIAGTLIVGRQVDYMQSKNPGFDTDHVVGFRNPSVPRDQWDAYQERLKAFHNTLRSHRSVVAVGSTSNLPGGGSSDINSNSGGIKIVGMTDRLEATTYIQWMDDRFNETMQTVLLAGRDFDRTIATDTAAVIVNESFLDRFGISDFASVLNKQIQFGSDPQNDKFRIVGVLKDFNRTSFKSQVEPTCYMYNPGEPQSVVRLEAGNYSEGIEYVEATWMEFFPDTPLDIVFLDQRFERLYKEDKRFGKVFGSFSVLAILVAILGLFGLSSFMAIQRTKEVGVRKVLGASIGSIITLFYKDFMILMGVSSLVGFPVVYFVMNSWLSNYAYRVDFPWLLLILAVAIILFFALITVGYQTSKVAALNPAKTLKYE